MLGNTDENNLPRGERPEETTPGDNPCVAEDLSRGEAQEPEVSNDSPGDMMEFFQAEMDRKDVEYQELLQQFVRLQADFENFRKRSRREQEQIVKFAAEKLIGGLLPVLDNLERALAASASQTEDLKSFVDGVEMIYRQLMAVLEREGLQPVSAVGQQFDPQFHEAVMQVSVEEGEENTVVEELQKGYTLGERVIRPAMVKVAKNS
ncbi:MAG: nucleotide exchange factor GrpE [Bacillota bacterium]